MRERTMLNEWRVKTSAALRFLWVLYKIGSAMSDYCTFDLILLS